MGEGVIKIMRIISRRRLVGILGSPSDAEQRCGPGIQNEKSQLEFADEIKEVAFAERRPAAHISPLTGLFYIKGNTSR
jgi:hypothetical protein